MRRSAFTLMELLIVITIILLLMGMVFIGVKIGREAARKAKTTDLIARLQGSITIFRTANGFYPERDANWATIFTTPDKISYDYATAEWESSCAQLVVDLNKAGESWKSPLLDGWKHTLRYRPAKFLPFKTGAVRDIDGDNHPPGSDSFQLWSVGSDDVVLESQPAHDVDDVVSWKQ